MSNTADPPSDFVDRPWMEGAAPPLDEEARTQRAWLVAAHAAPLLLWVLYPYGSALIIPLLIWKLKAEKDGNEALVRQSVEALNFQINLTLACIALSITIVGLFVVPIVMVAGLVFSVIASVKTYRGKDYRYPWIVRLVRVD